MDVACTLARSFSRTFARKLGECFWSARILYLLMLTFCGCTTTLIPPPDPPQATTVLVTDYGRHSSLILPNPDGSLVEYAFGDWDWFALEHTNAIVAIHALIHSPQSTLGRRTLVIDIDATNVTAALGAVSVKRIIVDAGRVAVLRQKLDAEYARHLDSLHFNPNGRLYFVCCDEPYDLFHNCNHETTKWLAMLGVRIEGYAILSHFNVSPKSQHVVCTSPARNGDHHG